MTETPLKSRVEGPITPERPLQDPAAVAGTPALAAIQQGLGQYLETQGYVAEHPLLYVNETEDPYVYVRFDISEDGQSFLDTTFVYSPSVAALIDDILDRYDVFDRAAARRPYTSEAYMGTRPVHAFIQLIKLYKKTETITPSKIHAQ